MTAKIVGASAALLAFLLIPIAPAGIPVLLTALIATQLFDHAGAWRLDWALLGGLFAAVGLNVNS